MKNDIKKYYLIAVNVNCKFWGQNVPTKKAYSLMRTVSLKFAVLKPMLLIFSFQTMMSKKKRTGGFLN